MINFLPYRINTFSTTNSKNTCKERAGSRNTATPFTFVHLRALPSAKLSLRIA